MKKINLWEYSYELLIKLFTLQKSFKICNIDGTVEKLPEKSVNTRESIMAMSKDSTNLATSKANKWTTVILFF